MQSIVGTERGTRAMKRGRLGAGKKGRGQALFKHSLPDPAQGARDARLPQRPGPSPRTHGQLQEGDGERREAARCPKADAGGRKY